MRQRKRRLCTALLCAVLIISNVLPAGMPVYAKSPVAGSVITDTVHSEGTASPMTAEGAATAPDSSDDTSNTSDVNTDADQGTDDGSASDSGNANDENGGANSDTNNGNSDNGDINSDISDANADNGDVNSDASDANGDNDSSDSDTPDTGDGSENDASDTDDGADTGDDPAADDVPVVDEDTTVSENDLEPDDSPGQDDLSAVSPYGDSGYQIDESLGYDLTDSTMTPGSYSAQFTAVSQKSIYSSKIRILYTTDETAANDFFSGVSKITASELTAASSFKNASFQNWESNGGWDESDRWVYNVSGSFIGDSALTPDTTYYYRLAYYNYDPTENAYCYYFLTLPDQFTTEAPITESSVSIKDISVEAVGYQRAKIVWTVDNPNQEFCSDMKLTYTDGEENGQSSSATPSEYRENYTKIPNKYYATIDLDWAKKAKAALTVYTGNGEETAIESEEITITPQDFNDAEIKLTEKIGSASFSALVELSPYYSVDNSIKFTLYYRRKSDQSWSSTNKNMSVSSDSASITLSASNLSENTEYEYYVVPSGRLSQRAFENLGNSENPLTFTTKGIVTYEDTEFPDEVFRSYLKQTVNISDSDKLTSDQLEKLTSISCQRSSASGDISSLRGIEHIENLTSINFNGHSITDAGGLDSLTALTYINLENNDLTALPDLSGMSQLTTAYFDYNLIGADTITTSKLPASLLKQYPNWITNTKSNQRGNMAVTLAPEYYASGDARPFLVKVTGLKEDYSRKYTLSLTIGGKTVSGAETSHSSYDIYYIKDILKDSDGADTGISVTAGTPCNAVITLTDSYGNEWLRKTADVTFAAADANTAVVKTQYIRPNASGADIYIENLPTTYVKANIASVVLIDQDGTQVGSASSISAYTNYYNAYEDVFGYFSISDLTGRQSVSLQATVYFAKYLSAGYYSAVITTTDGTASTYEKAVHVADMAVAESLSDATAGYGDKYYDNYGDYLYVMLNGANIDPTKVRPVFRENDEDITEYVSSTTGDNCRQAVYKLKKRKKDTYWNISASKTFTYELQTDPGYTILDTIKNKSFTLNPPDESHDFVTFEHYNYKKGVYEVKTDSTVADQTKVSVSVYSDYQYSDLKGTAEGEITNSMLSLAFQNEQGESYAPPRNQEAYFQYAYTDSAGNEKTFQHQNYVNWYNYYVTSKSAYNRMVLYHETLLKKFAIDVFIPEEKIALGQDVTAQVCTENGNTVGDSVTLSGKDSQGYINYTGTWESAAGLGEGVYQVRYSLNGKELYKHDLYVYDDTRFYMNNQWTGTWSDSSGSGIVIGFSSERLAGRYIHTYNSKVSDKSALDYWNKGGYKLELFDRLGNPINGWKVDHAAWSNGDFRLYLKDVPQGYTGFYAKITQTDCLGIRLGKGTVYYTNEAYGQWATLGGSSVWFNDDSSTNAYCGFGAYEYPVTVTITKPYDTDVIHTFKVSAATSGSYYYFTASDLKDIDPKEAYRITAESVDGGARSAIGYLAVRGTTTVVNATSVTLDKTTLNMQLAQTQQLTATVKPDNATNKNITWSSSDESVATVDAQGNVTAVSVGTATVTAAAHNDLKASCTVQIFNYTLLLRQGGESKPFTELSFDLTGTVQPVTLAVSDGTNDISSAVTWSSTDESVATVANGGVVTPQGAGTARILAAVKNGPTLACGVTVSRDELTAVTLSDSASLLYLDSKGQTVTDEQGRPVPQMPDSKLLRLYFTPSDTTAVSAIAWSSSDPAVAEVAADADDQTQAVVTARSKGTAKITVSVTTKAGKTETRECSITVKTVTTASDIPNIPTGLTALTNEQLTLADVTLPTGWEWQYPDVSLKQFSGMQAKAFAAQYTNPAAPDAEPYETELSVALATVTGIAIGADSNLLWADSATNNKTTLSVAWDMNGSRDQQHDMTACARKITWSSDKESVATVTTNADDGVTTLTAQGVGKATVKAQVTFRDGKTYKAQYKITVVDGEPAQIQVTAVDRFTADASLPDAYRGTLDGDASNNTGAVHVTVTGASKLTVKNNNAKVIATGKPTAEGSGYSIPLTIKAAGMAKLTLTANDAAKTQKDIYLYVTDAKPCISEDTVTVNLWQTTGSTFTLYPNEGYRMADALPTLAGDNASKFTLEKAAEDSALAAAGSAQAKYIIKAKDGTAKGSYKLTLQGKVMKSEESNQPNPPKYDFDNVAFTVKVVDQAPKYKVKQSAKVNLFYSNWRSRLDVTSDETLDSIELTGCTNFKLERDENDGAYYLAARNTGLETNCDKKGTLTLRFRGYKDVTTNLTVGVEKKAPTCTLKNKSMTIYPEAGLDSAILNPLVRQPDGQLYSDVLYTLDQTTGGAGFSLMHDQNGNFILKFAKGNRTLKNTTYKATFTLTHPTWAKEVIVPFTIKVNINKPAAKLAKTTLQLNTNAASMAYDTAATEVMWKDGAVFNPLGVSVSAADVKAQGVINSGIVFGFDRTRNNVTARLNNVAVAKGSYKFRVNVRATDSLTISTPLTVKIVDVAMDKAVKVSAKGSIDVLNREGTFVTVTPALKSLNGTIADVRLSGRAAHLFSAECADNKVIIHAKPNAALITKYNYTVKLNLTIENAEGHTLRYTTPEINLKLKQGKPKVTVAPKNATLFSGSYESVTRSISATLKGAENPFIESVELLNNNDSFACGYEDGVITLTNTPNTVKGKSYSLQLRITFAGQADNEKATTVKYTVKVK